MVTFLLDLIPVGCHLNALWSQLITLRSYGDWDQHREKQSLGTERKTSHILVAMLMTCTATLRARWIPEWVSHIRQHTSFGGQVSLNQVFCYFRLK